ncbi:MFS general substrate transporter [Meredithblackwellia eburnea MCA 4105]
MVSEKNTIHHVESGPIGLAEVHKAAASHRALNSRVVWNNIWGSIGGFIFGWSNNVIGTTLAQPSFVDYFKFSTIKNLEGFIGAVVCMYHVGGLLGFFAQSYVSDKYGRKKGALWAASIVIIGQTLTGACAQNNGMLLFARFVTGFGGWPCAAASVTYCSELSIAETRGFLAGIVGFSIGLGYATTAWVGAAFFHVDVANTWRIPVLIGLAFPAAYILLMPTVDESPRWLSQQGRYEEARDVVRRMHRSSFDPNNIYADSEAAQLRAQAELDKTLPDGTWASLWTKPGNRKRCMFVILAATGQMCTGVGAILSFGPTLYAGLGYNTSQQLFFSAGFNSISPLESIFMMYIVDKVGRKVLIACCPLLSSICLFVYAALVRFYANSDDRTGKAAAVALLFLYFFCYLFIEVAVFVLIGEMFPLKTRSKGVTVGLSTIAFHSIWTTVATPRGLAVGGYRFMFLFGGLSVIFGILIVLYLPETKGVSLEHIALLLGEDEEVAKVSGHASPAVSGDEKANSN